MLEGQENEEKPTKEAKKKSYKAGEKPTEGGVPQAKEKPKYFQEEEMITSVKPC